MKKAITDMLAYRLGGRPFGQPRFKRSKKIHRPHRGERERARTLRNMERGMINNKFI